MFGSDIGPIQDNFYDICIKIKEHKGNLVQIFSSTKKTVSELNKLGKWLKDNKMHIVVHASYNINLAREWDEYSNSIINFINEINYAHNIGAFGIVIHVGKSLDLSKEEAYNNMFSALLYIHMQTKQYSDVKIIIETPAGQGTELCVKIEDLAYFFKKFSKNKEIGNRFGLCVDTCHIFSAGYDISNITKTKLYLEAFEELIGINNIKLIHLNDSKTVLGSHIDRHADIGSGTIGFNSLKYVFDFFQKIHTPIVLETEHYLDNITKLLE